MQGLHLFLICFGIAAVSMLILWKLEEIYAVLQAVKRTMIDCYSRITQKTQEIEQWEHLVFEENGQWYCHSPLIAHACGGNVRMCYTNSRDALIQSVADGVRVIEADIRFTSDRQIVCAHDFIGSAGTLDYDTFMSGRIDGRFSPMDLTSCMEMIRASDAVLILDVKKREEFPEIAEWIKKNRENTNLVIQIAGEEELEIASGLPVLYNLTFTQDYRRVAAFCLTNGIRVVSISAQRIKQDMQWKILLDHNIKVYAHTVNGLLEYEYLRRQGVAGVFTDSLIPDDLSGEKEIICD